MTTTHTSSSSVSQDTLCSGRLFLLELSSNSIYSMNPDGSDRKTIVTGCHLPDGIAVDAHANHCRLYVRGVRGIPRPRLQRPRLSLNQTISLEELLP
jgi:hypothetical protein